MKTIAAMLFGAGVLLSVRVMFFGVRRSIGSDAFRTSEWPLAFSATLGASGVLLYGQALRGGSVTFGVVAAVVVLSGIAGGIARVLVQRSEAAAALSPDPDEDPRYKFQGHVARLVAPLSGNSEGRVSFV